MYFFSLDAGRRLAVAAARALLNLPYYAAVMSVERRGPPFLASAGSIDYFLTERYCLYHRDHRGRPYRLEIHHRPWSLQLANAAITTNTMAAGSDFTLNGSPALLHFARRQDVVAWGADASFRAP